MVKELRQRTGAPIGDAQKALKESNGSMDEAMEWLRRKGLAAAAKKAASRHAADGLVALATAPGRVAVVEVNSETDFVARNETFQALLRSVSQSMLSLEAAPGEAEIAGDVVGGAKVPEGAPHAGMTAEEAATSVSASVREKVSLRRGFLVDSPGGVIGTYVHGQVGDGVGRIAGVVALEGAGDAAGAERVAQGLAMHVAAMRPRYVTAEDVPAEVREAERKKHVEAAVAAGKPADIAERVADGQWRKWLAECCLVEQEYVLEEGRSVRDVVGALGKGARVARVVRAEVGEGLSE
ncbi:unnamed protein product [Pedinophyceae sp. YPF-701]|nr:unnamed protein product [Pedinophyceae sp. YPF-701]